MSPFPPSPPMPSLLSSSHRVFETALLEGAEREAVLALFTALDHHLRGFDRVVNPAPEGMDDPRRAWIDARIQSFANNMGTALYLGYRERSLPGHESAGAWESPLDAAFAAVNAESLPAHTIGGFTQTAWTAEHLAHLMSESNDASGTNPPASYDLEEVDDFLRTILEKSPWTGSYDLIVGLVGYGTYALERLPHPMGATLLELVVHRLEELAEPTPEGATWFTPGTQLPAWQREVYPDGWYNLGVAHGVPGVIGILAEAVAMNIAVDRARPLLEKALGWFLAQRLPPGRSFDFRAHIMPGVASHGSERLAWCYGDAGIAIVLLTASRSAGLGMVEEVALDIARKSALRDPATAGVVDGSLCHGACGLGHIFHRLWRATGERCHAEAARFWFLHASQRFAERGLVGLMNARDIALERDLLTGSAGMGLTLLSALSTQPPEWDRLLLMSSRAAQEVAESAP